MAVRATCIALLPAVLLVAGCGTVANLANSRPEEGGTSPFGGVKHDLACIRHASSGEFGVRAHPKSESDRYPQGALMFFCAADLPFSLIGDIVTWPFAVVYSVVNEPIPVPPVVAVGTPAVQGSPATLPPMPIPTPPAMLPAPGAKTKN